jgi:hypothetical protein
MLQNFLRRSHLFAITRVFIAQIRVGLILLVVIGVGISITACAGRSDEGFAIYLAKEDISPAQLASLKPEILADQPLITQADVVTYNRQTYELKLTPDAFDRICQLEVPTTGTNFVVCVNQNPVYWGAFWTPISSQSFAGVTIWKPYQADDRHIVTFELGYPAPSFYAGEDPRNNQAIVDAFAKANQLITALTIADIKALPKAGKGYELYSWQAEQAWHFTLISGTNRNKTTDEIVADELFISETGWIKIHCVGEDAIKDVLSKVPPGEWIIWFDDVRWSDELVFSRPPQEISERIIKHALAHGLAMS